MGAESEKKLIEAARYNSIGGVRFFIKRVPSLNCMDESGWTSLHWAVSKGSEEIAELLLEAGADAKAKTPSGDSALHMAAQQGFLRLQRLLIKHGADIHDTNGQGETCVEIARRRQG